MSIIKYDISNEILYDFLKIHCTLENNYYVLNNLIYKKYIYYHQLDSFINKLKDKYRKDQINYLTRNMTSMIALETAKGNILMAIILGGILISISLLISFSINYFNKK